MGKNILGGVAIICLLALAACSNWPDTVRHTMSHDSEINDTARGYPVPWQAATRFTSAEMSPYVGEKIVSVRIFIATVPTTLSVQVYRGGAITPTLPAVVDQAVSESFLAPDSWNEIVIATPPIIVNDDYWIGVSETGSGKTILGADAGPANPEGDWQNLNSGGWVHSGEGRNWNIRAIISD
jgi:hypothetical protein